MIRQLLLCLILLTCCGPLTVATAARGAEIANHPPAIQRAAKPSWSSLSRTVQRRVLLWQKTLRRQLTRQTAALQTDPWGRPLWHFLLLAGLYGIVHALGPGHGKAVAGSFFAGRQATMGQGCLLGFSFAFLHVLSAAGLLLAGHGLARLAPGHETLMPRLSATLLVIMGLILAGRALLSLRTASPAAPASQPTSPRDLWTVTLITGLVPCPGAALLLFFALNRHLLAAGLLGLLAMALGMGITVSAVAASAIAARSTLLRHLPVLPERSLLVARWLALGGGLAMTAIGILLLA
jgi:ABC-type nickel/cobalt efflux system permease component RcnA